MNRRGFLGGLMAAAVVPFVPMPAPLTFHPTAAAARTMPDRELFITSGGNGYVFSPQNDGFGVDYEWDSGDGLLKFMK